MGTGQKTMEEQKELIKKRIGGIQNKLMVMSGKGGVGKTTVAVNLAFALQMNGLNTGILDADIHGPNVPKMLGIEGTKPDTTADGILPAKIPIGVGRALEVMSLAFFLEADSPVIWRGPLKMGALQQFLSDVCWGEDLDYLIVDLPPGTGDEPLSIAQLIPDITGSIIVTTPQEVALMDSRRSVNFSRKLNVPVMGVVENMSGLKCPHCGGVIDLFKVGGGEKAAKELGVPFLGRIPIEPVIVKDSDEGKPFILNHPDSEAGKAFNRIVDEIKRVNQK
ncbi:MAG: Mrp/NBP35 family ATP-binding protein [Candidatus Altiarchaeota archaeon]|nr:Mrp/NBP35 family ATP-binding protein [Candidatus Altiarchaeota archaeon]